MVVAAAITAILWGTLVMLIALQYIEICKELSWSKRMVVIIIFLVGAPFLALGSIFETLLDNIMPDGWNGDDDEDGKH
jgi:hypothetical protein